MRLLVTGGAGYIGSIVAQRLIARGDEVTVLDSLYRGHRAAVPEGAEFVQADLLDTDALRDALAGGFDGVLHFAAVALVEESVSNPERYYRTNVVGSLNLLDAMREHGVSRIVFSSTCATYGQPDVVPISENESTTPYNAYGATKLTVDRMLTDESRAHGLAAVSLRYFNVAGAAGPLGEDHEPETHLIPLILWAAAGRRDHVSIFGTDYPTEDGSAVRDYVHIEDLAEAHMMALDNAQPGAHEIFNLGSGTGYSVREVIDAVKRVTGRDVEVREEERRPGDAPRLVAANRKAREQLGWEPRRSLDDMVADAWEWYQAHPRGYA